METHLSVAEAAKQSGTTRAAVLAAIATGALPAEIVRTGKRVSYRIASEELKRWQGPTVKRQISRPL